MHLRVLDDGPHAAVHNMAVDEALLRGDGAATLRLYRWQPHAVSIGYFQRAAEFADLPPDTPWVRRSTGGGAIHHGDEVTFALALDAALLPGDVGVACTRRLDGAACGARPGVRWCFAEPGRHDLVDAIGRKLVGSAQRRLQTDRARVLHHGSIVVRRPALTPFVAAIEDQTDPDAARARLPASLAQRLAAALAMTAQPDAVTAAELAEARDLAANRFGHRDFHTAR